MHNAQSKLLKHRIIIIIHILESKLLNIVLQQANFDIHFKNYPICSLTLFRLLTFLRILGAVLKWNHDFDHACKILHRLYERKCFWKMCQHLKVLWIKRNNIPSAIINNVNRIPQFFRIFIKCQLWVIVEEHESYC